jgi:DNA-binding response OmpR family regulator
LAAGLSETDQRALATLSGTMSWKLICAGKLAEARRKAKSRAVRVILCERDLPDGNWKVLFEQVRNLGHGPRFIVASRLADESLWAEVLNSGGYDVLATPFDAEEVSRVVSYAMVRPLRDLEGEEKGFRPVQ